MGRGNVGVSGPYEGLFYIDNDNFHVYRYVGSDTDEDFELESRFLGELSYDELTNSNWAYDEWETSMEQEDIEECFIADFTNMFKSFSRPTKKQWLRNGLYGNYSRLVLLENKLFYICLEDNEWSLALELIQKEDPYDDHLAGLQSRHFQKYLDGIKKCLLNRLPSIGGYCGAWSHRVIMRDDI